MFCVFLDVHFGRGRLVTRLGIYATSLSLFSAILKTSMLSLPRLADSHKAFQCVEKREGNLSHSTPLKGERISGIRLSRPYQAGRCVLPECFHHRRATTWTPPHPAGGALTEGGEWPYYVPILFIPVNVPVFVFIIIEKYVLQFSSFLYCVPPPSHCSVDCTAQSIAATHFSIFSPVY